MYRVEMQRGRALIERGPGVVGTSELNSRLEAEVVWFLSRVRLVDEFLQNSMTFSLKSS